MKCLEVKKHLYLFLIFLFFPKLQRKYKQNITKIECYGIEVPLEEGKISSQKELAEGRLSLIIKPIKTERHFS